jgi:hypothetical protein
MKGAETGLEDLTIEFPDPGWGHYQNYNGTSGYNGIDMSDCTNCWVKNVSIKKSDNGIFVDRSTNATLDGLHVYSRPGGAHLHVAYVGSKSSLTKNSRMYGTSAHGLTTTWGEDGSVFANGWGENLDIEPDHGCPNSPRFKNVVYSNIAGTIRRFQTKDWEGGPFPTIHWNVGAVDRYPLDVYTAQH